MSFFDEITEAQRVYKDILNGFSVFKKDGETFFVKHFTEVDHGWIQEYKKECFQRARKKGLAKESEQLKLLSEQQLWSREQEKELDYWKMEISNLEVTKAKLILAKQINQVKKQIRGYERKIKEAEEERAELLGLTCESFAEKKVSEYYMFYSLYKDQDLKHKYYKFEDYEELSSIEISEMVKLNNRVLSDFNNKNLKKIAACPFFLNSVMISKNNPFIFFGKPIVELTNYQQEMWGNGIRFKNIIEQKNDTPPKMLTLQDVVDWYENAAGSLESANSKDKVSAGGAKSIVGATSEELEKLTSGGDDGKAVDLHAAAAKHAKKNPKAGKDGVFTMHDMMKIHGDLD